MKEMVLIKNPNLSIVLPGRCNAKCDFCFTDYSKEKDLPSYDDYLFNLYYTLTKLPENFDRISITGGEPTISNYLDFSLMTIKMFRDRYKFVVMSTNATGLSEKRLDKMVGIVDAVNISRHYYDDEINNGIFKLDSIPSTEKLRDIISNCWDRNIAPSLSVTMTSLTTKDEILRFIDFANGVGIDRIRFRHVQTPTTIVDRHGVELEFDEEILDEGRCPVCRHTIQKINGTHITWISSTLEPSNDWDVIYEAIFHQNATLTIDWAGEREFVLDEEID